MSAECEQVAHLGGPACREARPARYYQMRPFCGWCRAAVSGRV